MSYRIYEIGLPSGARLGLGRLPSAADIVALKLWEPDAVLSLTQTAEMHDLDLRASFGQKWHHLPVQDFGTPDPQTERKWNLLSPMFHEVLDQNGAVFAHCLGGKGRSGMILLRLMVERGMPPDAAIMTLRNARPGAVETDQQRDWATTL